MKERMKRKPFLQPCCLVLAQKKSKYYISISCLGTGKVEILQFIFLEELVGSDIGKVEILQYYLICVLPDRERKSVRGRQGHQSRCHGLSTFLAELVVFGIGKVEILQYYLIPMLPDSERKSRNVTILSHGRPFACHGLSIFLAN